MSQASEAPLLRDGHALLADLARDAVRPADALARVAALRAAHPGVEIELVWEETPADGSLHYDLLLRGGPEAAGTLSLSWCPDGALPFALRGAHRWSDRDLLRVDGVPFTVPEAMIALELLWREARLIDRVIDSAIVKRTLLREPIDLDEEAQQAAVDAFRAARGLTTASATSAWLRDRGFAVEQLLELACDEAILAALRARVARPALEGRLGADGLAALDPARRAALERELFEAWLAAERRRAAIEWNWGPA
jgi:putative peptide maturation system protein